MSRYEGEGTYCGCNIRESDGCGTHLFNSHPSRNCDGKDAEGDAATVAIRLSNGACTTNAMVSQCAKKNEGEDVDVEN